MLKEIITSYIDTYIKCLKSKFPFLNGYWIPSRDAVMPRCTLTNFCTRKINGQYRMEVLIKTK